MTKRISIKLVTCDGKSATMVLYLVNDGFDALVSLLRVLMKNYRDDKFGRDYLKAATYAFDGGLLYLMEICT